MPCQSPQWIWKIFYADVVTMQIATLCIVLIYLSRVNVLSLLHTNKQFRLQLYHVKTLFLPKPSSPYPRGSVIPGISRATLGVVHQGSEWEPAPAYQSPSMRKPTAPVSSNPVLYWAFTLATSPIPQLDLLQRERDQAKGGTSNLHQKS